MSSTLRRAVAGALIGCFPLHAVWAEPVQVHGFVSQSFFYSPDNPYYDDESGGHFNFREAGLSGSWTLNPAWRLAGGVISRRAGGFSDSSPRVDFLLLDYNFLLEDRVSAGVRLGRVKNEYGIYNAIRDVPHVRPGVLVPPSVYFEGYRGPFVSVDGSSLYLDWDLDQGRLTADVFAGESALENNSIEYMFSQRNLPGRFEDVDILGVRLGWTRENIGLMFTLGDVTTVLEQSPSYTSQQQFDAILDIVANPQHALSYLNSLKLNALLKLTTFQYLTSDWAFTAEHLLIDVNLDRLEIADIPAPSSSYTLQSFYLQGEWFTNDKLSFYTRYEELYYDNADKSGREFAARTGGTNLTQYAKAVTLGSRWHANQNLSLTMELSQNRGAGFIAGQEGIDYSQLKKEWNLFILQATYHF